MRLESQVALVTGSATGIGRATALALAREGADVVVNYAKSEQEARETTQAVERTGRRALLVRADVASDAQVCAMVAETERAFGRLDILVNNAGTTAFVKFADLDSLTDEVWDRILAVNLKGCFFCSRAAAKLMRKHGSGCIVNVASDSAFRPSGSSIPYCASKAGIVNLTATLSVALAPEIRVNAVAPGMVDTRWHAWRHGDWYDEVTRNTLLNRYGHAEDIAEVVVGLVTNAGFVTGQTILVDGGLRYP